MIFRQLFDKETSTYTYLLADPDTREAILIDPVREQVDRDQQLLRELGLTLKYTLETHVHADHVTASGLLRQALGSRSVLSSSAGASCADIQIEDGEVLSLGGITIEARHTPGHTSGCVSYYLPEQKMIFTGDALLIRGCGRTDFQQGDARMLYGSIHGKVFTLDDAVQIYPGHDYKGRTSSTVGEERAHNPRLGGGRTVEQFVEIMGNLQLAQPSQIHIAVPANLECGLPPAAGKSWAPIERTDSGVPEVTVAWTATRVGTVRIIDVRQPEEFTGELGHIDGAELVPLATLEAAAAGWPRDAALVVVCRSGGRSGAAARVLENLGFEKIASMAGGMLAWSEARLPVG